MDRKLLFLIILAAALVITGGCRRTGGGPAYYGGGEETNVVEGSTVVGEVVPADENVGEQVDEFAGGGEFSNAAATAAMPPAGTAETVGGSEVGVVGSTGGTAEGYRVQVIAVSFEDNARAIADKIRAAYPGVGVYVQHIQGLYKVRVGDYRDRAAAEGMRDKLKGAGYSDAWVLKEQVNTQ
jgi:hypothetical protein